MTPIGPHPVVVEATLDYDSALDTLCGARGFGTQPRMLLYKWGALTVDLHVWVRGHHSYSVHGQVIETAMHSPVVGAEASAGSEPVLTDRFGEFTVALGPECRPHRLRVRTAIADVVCVLPEAA